MVPLTARINNKKLTRKKIYSHFVFFCNVNRKPPEKKKERERNTTITTIHYYYVYIYNPNEHKFRYGCKKGINENKKRQQFTSYTWGVINIWTEKKTK